VRRVDCSKFSDPRPRNFCHQVECLFSEKWGHWCERSEAGGFWSPWSAGSRQPGTMELDLAATCKREWPACSRPAASPEASAGYEEWCKKVKSFPSHMRPWAVLISVSYSPQPDTSLHCEATNTGLVYRAACLFTPQLSPVPSYTAWWQRHMGVRNLPRVFTP